MRWLIICSLLLAVAISGCSEIQEPTSPVDSAYTLQDLYFHLRTIDDLEQREVLSPQAAQTQREFYLEAAQTTAGEPLTEAQLADRVFSSKAQQYLRFITFVNIIWAFASLLIVLGAAWVFRVYIFPLLKRVPIIIYEILLYAICAAFIAGGNYVKPEIGQFVALPGVLALIWLLPFSYGRRVIKAEESGKKRNWRDHQRAFMLQYLILSIIWGGTAIFYDSVLIGFLTVGAVIATVGLSSIAGFAVRLLGFERTDVTPIVLVVTFGLVLLYVFGEVWSFSRIYADIFAPGVFWIGTYAYFVALGVMASRYYHRKQPARFWMWQLVAIGSAIGAVLIGSLLEIQAMQEEGGTFLLFYILEKYIEMQNWRRYWGWALLGLGILLYIVALLINQYPQFFVLS